MMRVADYIMQRLYNEGCNHIFMITGRGMLYLSDAVARHENLQAVSTHNEQAAAYSAMAYAQTNEKLGACMVSTGCAGTNAVTGVLCAWQDDVPCIFISGQNKLEETVRHTALPIRTYGQQEADIVKIVEPITKYAVMIENPEDIAYEMDKALYLAQTGRKGPVWIDVPLDVQNMRIEPDNLKRFIPKVTEFPAVSKEVAEVLSLLEKAERPVILVGGGVRSAGAVKELQHWLEKSQIPIVYTASAVDVLDNKYDLSIGCVGAMGANRAANFAVQNSDLLLVIGSRLSSMTVGSDITKFARDAKIIVVDIDENEPQKYPNKFSKIIQSDAKLFLEELNQYNFSLSIDDWQKICLHWKSRFPKCDDKYKSSDKVDLYYLADSLSRHLKDDAVFVCDAGLEELIMPSTIDFNDNKRCIHPASQGAMGYALPAAVGACYAGGKQVATVIGDGSIMMNLQELQTISHNQLPIKIFVVNNDCYAVIRKRQQDLFRTRTIGTDASNGVSCPDFQKVADCFNIQYEKIESSKELDRKLAQVLAMDGAVLCEIMGKEVQEYLHSSYRKNSNGRFVQPPIEDQSPFLERELFLSEMIVQPIDN